MRIDRECQIVRGKPLVCATIKVLLLGLSVLLNVRMCLAATHTWNGSVSDNWFVADNWTPTGVPGTNDTVIITTGSVNLTAVVAIHGTFNWSGGTLSGDGITIESGG